MSMRRLERLERKLDVDDWRLSLPEGITVAYAEQTMETLARMTADYLDAHPNVSLEEAARIALDMLVAKAARADALGDDDDDDEL